MSKEKSGSAEELEYTKDPTGYLLYVAPKGYTNRVKELIDAGADINAKDNNGRTVLNLAVEEGHTDVVKVLIANGVDLNDGSLHGAAALGYKDIANMLINAGAYVNDRSDELGYTPLMSAALRENPEIIELLIANGADINARCVEMNTPLIYAAIYGCPKNAEVLIANGADINAKNNNGQTALMFAALNEHVEVARLLIDAGANVNAKDNNGKTAFIIAREIGNDKIADFLKEVNTAE